MSVDYAHTSYAEVRRLAKAKTLARWCYERGIDAAVVNEADDVLRAIARRAAVTAPHVVDSVSATWIRVGELLDARAEWDRVHGVTAPQAAGCIRCVAMGERCAGCAAAPGNS